MIGTTCPAKGVDRLRHRMTITKKYINELTYQIIGCAIEVHKHLGPGLLESVYEKCFLRELKLRGIEALCTGREFALCRIESTTRPFSNA